MGQRSRHYTPAERAEIMIALRESADDNDGTPAWHTVSKATDVPRATLRRWWEQRDRKGELCALPPPERPAPETFAMPDVRTCPPSEFLAWLFLQVQTDVEFAQATSPTSLPGMRRMQLDVFDRLRRALADEQTGEDHLTPEQQLEVMASTMRDLPPRLAVVAADELRRRGFA